MNLNDYVPAFVKAYYSYILTSPRDVKKFYSPTATYYRSYMNTSTSQQINLEQVCPHIAQNSTIKIKNFVSAPIPKTSSISVSVNGSYQSSKKASCFSQYFILQEIGGRICVVSDIYNEFNETDFIKPDEQQQQQPSSQTTPTANTNSPPANTNPTPAPTTNPNSNANTNNNNNNNNNHSRQGRRSGQRKNNNFVYTPG